MAKLVPADELATYIGAKLGPSEWLHIDQDRIDAFADVTLDHQFIHIDPEAAAKTEFGSTIAHGFLTLSLLSYLCSELTLMPEHLAIGINYGFDSVRFVQPVVVDSWIRAHVSVLDVNNKGQGRYLIKNSVTVEIKGQEKPALVAEWLGMGIVNP
ncbi:MAG: MaoC family dehydratase [Acidimicrobiia bacterium]|nr:MaoC family dehydratase [Acidimicrobiia bacterium]MBT8250754.1 MaoC family dehydratase [Acidimicrobiia bacterium]NNC43282.1 MaoC family dehydratase [Acidimicrobiia bacterium]NNL28918.1 MaoC family dehydratase [Acidimicrobiia bacterium]NNL47996.1 MaoC family dehydratase [Acidimicrobiia bacterium]